MKDKIKKSAPLWVPTASIVFGIPAVFFLMWAMAWMIQGIADLPWPQWAQDF